MGSKVIVLARIKECDGTMQITNYRLKTGISKPIRIAVVADLHNAPTDNLFSNIESNHPDIIIIAGDLVYGRDLDKDKDNFIYEPDKPMLLTFPNADDFIHRIPSIAPTFFAYGNHEWLLMPADIDRIKKAGVKILHNTWTKWNEVYIGGLSSPDVTNYWVFQDEWRKAHPTDSRGNLRRSYFYWKTHELRKTVDASWLTEFESAIGYKILICHHPEYWSMKEPKLENHPIDLVIAGHAHGGQIRIENRGLYASGQGWLPKYTSGIHNGDYGYMIVSRGLSNTLRIPRIFNPCEMVYIDLIPS